MAVMAVMTESNINRSFSTKEAAAQMTFLAESLDTNAIPAKCSVIRKTLVIAVIIGFRQSRLFRQVIFNIILKKMNELNIWIKETLYPAIFQEVDRIFPEHQFTKFSQGWRSKTYLSGQPHRKRCDKTVITKKYPGRILEQGGETMSLIDYVMNRDGVEFMDAVKRLAATVGLTPPGVKNSLVSSIVDKRRNSGFDYQPPPGQDYLPGNLVSKAGRNYKNNNFIQYLKSIFGPESTRQAIHKYLIGTSDYWPGGTIFWQIDDHGRVRHGKIMLYNPETGKRVKEPRPHIYSVAKLKGLKDFNLKQCLFGLHLLIESDSDMVAIVEAEKTATAMSIIKPQVPWMATGSKHGFNYEMLKPLRNKHIMAYPDKGEYLGWQAEALDLNDIGFNIRVDDTLENSLLPKGTDLADLVLQHENNSGIRKCDQVSDQKVRIFPKTIYREEDQSAMRIHTKSERDVLRLAKKNPSILKLVEVFDLTHPNGNNLHLPKW